MATSRIIVTGANGQLGSCLREIAVNFPRFEFVFTDVEELDITDQGAVKQCFEQQKPQWIINAAAYTAVDGAESEPEKAFSINAQAVGILAKESAAVGASFLHISTDYVFDGSNPNPLTENDITNPLSVYGKSKLEGEQLAMAGNANTVIIRTSWLYSEYGNNFVRTIRRLGSEKQQIDVVADQWGCPTSAHALAEAIMRIVAKPVFGLYHYSNEGVTNWALFAEEIMVLSGLACRVKHITTAEYPAAAAPRPEFSILDKKRIKQTFQLNIAEWEDCLQRVIEKL